MKSILITLVLFSFLLLGCSAEEKPTSAPKQNTETPPTLTPSISPVSEPTKTENMEKLEEEINLNKTIEEAERTNTIANKQQDPLLVKLSQRLKTEGIDCKIDYSTKNSLAIDPNDPKIIYVAISGKGIFKSTDKGIKWKKITDGILAYPNKEKPQEFCYNEIGSIIFDPTNTKHLLVNPIDLTTGTSNDPYTETAGIWESFNGGETWHQLIQSDINALSAGALAIDPNNPKIIYHGVVNSPASFAEADQNKLFNTDGVLYKTTNGGMDWEELPTGLLPELKAVSLFIDHKNSNNLILLTEAHEHPNIEGVERDIPSHKQFGPMKSNDGGKTWVSLADKLPEDYRLIFEGDVSTNFNHILVNPFVFDPGLIEKQKSFYSIDGGQTFKESNIYIEVARYNPHDKDGNYLLGYTILGGAYIMESEDAGATWNQIGNAIPQLSNHSVRISNFVWDTKDRNTVYMSGTMGNVWQSIDGGKNWRNILSLDKLPKEEVKTNVSSDHEQLDSISIFLEIDNITFEHYWPLDTYASHMKADESEVLVYNNGNSPVQITSTDMKFIINDRIYDQYSGTWEKFESKTSWEKIEYININPNYYNGEPPLILQPGQKGKIHYHYQFDQEVTSNPNQAVKIKITFKVNDISKNIDLKLNRKISTAESIVGNHPKQTEERESESSGH